MVKCFLAYLILSFLSFCAFAQKTVKVFSEYTYIAPENITVEQAKLTALDRAKIQAIADEFGTIVTQSNSTVVSNVNGESNIDFMSVGGSDVKGEWLETIGEPEFAKGFSQDGQMWVRCRVQGLIREITTAHINIDVKILRNGTDTKFEDYNFKDGDDLFLYFKSPVDGFLTVYMLDQIAQTAYCLLPYSQSSDMSQRIEHDQCYVFFSTHHTNDKRSLVDEIMITCSSNQELNEFFIVFSPNGFSKANSEISAGPLPRQLPAKDFRVWLTNIRKRDKDMNVVQKVLTIKK